jgi:hypothetical protein
VLRLAAAITITIIPAAATQRRSCNPQQHSGLVTRSNTAVL